MDCSPPGSSVHGVSADKNTGVGSLSLLLGTLPDPGIEPGSPVLQVDSLSAELLGKPIVYYTMKCYSVIKKNKFESVLVRWMNLEPVIEGSKSEREKQILYINAYIWNLLIEK